MPITTAAVATPAPPIHHPILGSSWWIAVYAWRIWAMRPVLASGWSDTGGRAPGSVGQGPGDAAG